ncbi:MAG TPA: basic amino acid ABC transporter substrate-binding protein [Anaerolineae bacterium]|nr:basic amino acid ABC transporter substrate-binding protein [Anaerolineae bacterium]
MKRALFLSLAVVMVLSLALAGCTQPAPPQAPTQVPAGPTEVPPLDISVVTDATWPPFEMVNETTKGLEGFDIDLMNAIAKEANLKINWVNIGWDALLAGMATGQYDASISVITITEDRKKDMLFSDPYYDAGQLIAVRIDNNDIKGPADLKGKVAGAQLDTTGDIEIGKIDGAKRKPYDDVGQAILGLINGQIDAVVADSPLIRGYVAKNASKIKSVGEPFTEEYYGIAVRKGGEAILARINAGLKAVKDQGLIEQLSDTWVKTAE